jgi:hypothetical protein
VPLAVVGQDCRVGTADLRRDCVQRTTYDVWTTYTWSIEYAWLDTSPPSSPATFDGSRSPPTCGTHSRAQHSALTYMRTRTHAHCANRCARTDAYLLGLRPDVAW